MGERFSIDPAEIESVFPPPLATGEYADSLPHVAFSRRTLPWERTSVATELSAPWLAVLLFDEDQAPEPTQRTAADLFPEGETIEVAGSATTGKGTLPAGYLSYPSINPLDYGESPEDACTTIDVPREVFDAIAPSAEDLAYLAHIREADTVDAHDHPEVTASTAIVLGNRAGKPNTVSHAFLVSLENMGPLLPGADGSPSKAGDAKCVRLLTYRYWTFTATDGGETLQRLLENLNRPPAEVEPLSTLQVPFKGARPTAAQVEGALKAQEQGQLAPAQSQVLVHDAMGMGYVPMPHHLRHGGETVSWYRGPFAPLAVEAGVETPISCPDAVNRYNPQTGMFDVSYGAAWQLGQLLALQNNAYAVALYQWRRELKVEEAAQAEQERIAEMLGGAFAGVLQARERMLGSAEDEMPPLVTEWLARLRLLHGVPFNYLVPNEQMLPPESLRFFHLDRAWMEALLDGALSIGRVTSGERELDARRVAGVHDLALEAGRGLRGNAVPVTDHENAAGEVTGFLLRSQAVVGWPKLNAKGYADAKGETEIKKLRLARLSDDTMLCLFDGAIEMAALREPPEQLHCGYEGKAGNLTTTLREVQGETPGRQYLEDPKGGQPVAMVSARADGRTIKAAATASNIENKLNTDFEQGLTTFTSAEFALEMVKGVVEVEYRRSS
ncbi:MAG TPA: hypothetical protein VGV69_01555 [Solirubrobacterales bacterium]|nr:hypothetical protein [Solirubrobacterales bacterium]